MSSGWVHNLNPVIAKLGDIQLYYYGLAYAVGFLGIYGWLRYRRTSLNWHVREVYDFSILFSIGVLLVGRLFSVIVYHRQYYQKNPAELLSYWQGGMATHGVLLGAVISMLIFSRWKKVYFFQLADEIVIPAAFLLALGRIGNFINGQIAGTETSAWWAIQFPNMEGFRHPVTLYEAAKNLLIIPILFFVGRKQKSGSGFMAAHFVFWYGFLRLFTDLFRDHGAQFLGIGVNQYYNAMMASAGVILMVVFSNASPQKQHRRATISENYGQHSPPATGIWIRQMILIAIVLFSLVVRSAWTPEVLKQRRSKRMTSPVELQNVDISERTLVLKGEKL
jgi:phosphatidylglycerol:prolipoprotein diacylglycerol transferase